MIKNFTLPFVGFDNTNTNTKKCFFGDGSIMFNWAVCQDLYKNYSRFENMVVMAVESQVQRNPREWLFIYRGGDGFGDAGFLFLFGEHPVGFDLTIPDQQQLVVTGLRGVSSL